MSHKIKHRTLLVLSTIIRIFAEKNDTQLREIVTVLKFCKY